MLGFNIPDECSLLNNITKDIFIGSSVNLTRRIAIHGEALHAGSNKETNIVFYRAMRKYGLENFSLAIIEFCTSDSAVCLELEQNGLIINQNTIF